jgi:hypothetical protein
MKLSQHQHSILRFSQYWLGGMLCLLDCDYSYGGPTKTFREN